MDDTIENLCEVWTRFLNERYGTNVHKDDIKDWDMSKAFPTLSHKEVYKPLLEEEMWKRVKPLPGAIKYVKKLIDDGHKVVVITASHPDTVSMKLNNVLFKYFPFFTYNDVIITTQKHMVSGDVLIDDAPHNLNDGKYYGILMAAPHNLTYDAGAHGIARADNWKEVYRIVCKYADKKGREHN